MTITYGWFLNWIKLNVTKFDDLVVLIYDLVKFDNLKAAWSTIKQIGDMLIDSTLPESGNFSVFSVEDNDALEKEVIAALSASGYSAQAWDGSRLRKIFDMIAPTLQLLLPILLAAK